MFFNHILVPTDFSTNAALAYDLAAHQAKFEGSRITLLNVVSDWVVPLTMYEYIPDPSRIDRYREDILANAKAKLEDIAASRFHGQKVEAMAIPSEKSPCGAICEYAREQGCDLIVMASRGHGPFGTLILGGTALRVLQHSPCPVMVMPCERSLTAGAAAA